MTEKQIEQLKKVLADSTLAQNSAELDDLILKSANEATQREQVAFEHGQSLRKLFTQLPVSFMRSAALAVMLTIGVFLAMGQLVSVDENIVVFDSSEVDINNSEAEAPVSLPPQTMIARPQNIALEPAPSRSSRDQTLMRFSLSDTEVLLTEFSFETIENSAFTQSGVEVALIDIHSLIQIGELEDARQRYNNLRIKCGDCGLPDTLEALVLEAQSMSTENSNAVKTG